MTPQSTVDGKRGKDTQTHRQRLREDRATDSSDAAMSQKMPKRQQGKRYSLEPCFSATQFMVLGEDSHKKRMQCPFSTPLLQIHKATPIPASTTLPHHLRPPVAPSTTPRCPLSSILHFLPSFC